MHRRIAKAQAMSDANKAILQKANGYIAKGDTEGFLAFCAEDIIWTTVGKETLRGKAAVRAWMATAYKSPPKFTVVSLIAESDYVAAMGEIEGEDEYGRPATLTYCDVWRFQGDEMVELNAFVIKAETA